MSNLYAVVMAGGVGSRFWPRSRERFPKQFLEIFGLGTMIQNTISRIEPLVPAMNTFVVTNALHVDAVKSQLPFLPSENVLVEPVGRNTAPCVGIAAQWIEKIDPEGVMIVLPADHLISNVPEFLRLLTLASRVAVDTNALLTIGIHPTHPETGFGYIQFDDMPDVNPFLKEGVYRVKTFAEKPTRDTAELFLKSGDFLWNSGMFVWKASAILKEIAQNLPELSAQLAAIEPAVGTPSYQSAVDRAYGVIRSISIDYGVMEKASNVFVVRGDFGWSDVGSWDEVVRLTPTDSFGNSLRGAVFTKEVNGSYIDAGKKFVAALGVDDLIIISTDDAVLVCPKGRSQEVKEIVDFLRRKQINELL
ncbi:MAG: mannose-1-phosphate guanylyltransferase [Ignavibacteriales bacterium]|nr:mannose-1-phosphate guanylyltransferase [Ignavibacteriales bacterium]